MTGTLSGAVGELMENASTVTYHGVHVINMSVWDQLISSGRRNSGDASSYVDNHGGTVPSTANITVLATPMALIGFQNSGTHYSSGGTSVYTANFGSANEYLPPDDC